MENKQAKMVKKTPKKEEEGVASLASGQSSFDSAIQPRLVARLHEIVTVTTGRATSSTARETPCGTARPLARQGEGGQWLRGLLIWVIDTVKAIAWPHAS